MTARPPEFDVVVRARAERCLGCLFWEALDPAGSPPPGRPRPGECRHLPPALPHYPDQEDELPYVGVFPVVAADQWCGAFQPGPPRARAGP